MLQTGIYQQTFHSLHKTAAQTFCGFNHEMIKKVTLTDDHFDF